MADVAQWLAGNDRWNVLSEDEKLAIQQFPILWALFELHATGRGRRPNATPRSIRAAVNLLSDDLILSPDLTAAHAYFSDRYSRHDPPDVLWRNLRLGGDEETSVIAGSQAGATNKAKLLSVLLILHRLRNNLVHGEKAVYSFSGQLQNFDHANDALIFAIELWPNPPPPPVL